MHQYDPNRELELHMSVGTADADSVTDNFAVLIDRGPLDAGQLQSMYEGGWHLISGPVVVDTIEVNVSFYYYTFHKRAFHG
ncbi:hypothetical protein ST201phi2-1p291 [Pseudomonas phage 201phi2-1]|uniref:Uncharacterized protein n=1 Tax=Pseudomonas phage 201phi2-1 TaxID=198110 RepID=B3FJF1_BP201|nr:hypothetical protein ST201phi2-1p291 [Pseudomonas phage 201phi2-1]ABY63117.1 hypothetical protein 201phi2-1p291 [Pseudomonas phage 201phi2-1]